MGDLSAAIASGCVATHRYRGETATAHSAGFL